MQQQRIPLRDKSGSPRAWAIVDAEDYAEVSRFTWCLDINGYARGYLGMVDGVKRYAQMHRYLLDCPKGLQVDHINHDQLDNRRANLRVVPQAGNAQNRAKRHGTSKYRGVYWNKGLRRWIAQAKLNNKTVYIGSFKDEADAGAAVALWRAEHMPYSREALYGEPKPEGLTEAQHDRRRKLARQGQSLRTYKVPEGSALVVRSDASGKPTWFEIVEPEPTFLIAYDVAD